MSTETTIQPIINGSVNPRLTREGYLNLDSEDKVRVLWGMACSMSYPHQHHGLDRDAFTPGPKYTYSELSEGDLDQKYDRIKTQLAHHLAENKAASWQLQREQGAEIKRQQRLLGFGGLLEMSAPKLQGYFGETGAWNDFDPVRVNAAIAQLDERALRVDYGPNNPNTGAPMHKWKTDGTYLVMEFSYVSESDLERIKAFYRDLWHTEGRAVKADSIRWEQESVNVVGDERYDVELILWWD